MGERTNPFRSETDFTFYSRQCNAVKLFAFLIPIFYSSKFMVYKFDVVRHCDSVTLLDICHICTLRRRAAAKNSGLMFNRLQVQAQAFSIYTS